MQEVGSRVGAWEVRRKSAGGVSVGIVVGLGVLVVVGPMLSPSWVTMKGIFFFVT